MRFRSATTIVVVVAVATVTMITTIGLGTTTLGPSTFGAGSSSGSAQWFAGKASPAGGAVTPSSPSASPVTLPPSPSAPDCALDSNWGCERLRRFEVARTLVAGKPGELGVIVLDRSTNAVWRAGNTTNLAWTASTVKLAIVAAVLDWQRQGRLTVDDTDRVNMRAALHDSSNDAATALWNRYGGQQMFDRFRTAYGMTSLSVVPGYQLFWRHLRCAAEDLLQLMSYVLNQAHLDDRAYLVKELREVASNQHWGVFAAGAALRPGNKNGWAQKPDPGGSHWVTHSVGFLGPGESHIVVVTYSLPPVGTLSDGVHTVSDLVATIFGAPTPAQVSSP